MPPKKNIIKIVDVDDKEIKNDNEYAITVDEVKESELPTENQPSETTEETTAIIQEKDEGTPEEVSKDTDASEPTKKIREQQLVQCQKCGKFVTPKTLKYTHGLKCGEIKKSRPKKSEIKINENVQENKPPDPVPIQKEEEVRKPPVPQAQPPKQIVKEVVKTFEEMRKDRLKERLKQREERNINLFKQVL